MFITGLYQITLMQIISFYPIKKTGQAVKIVENYPLSPILEQNWTVSFE